MLRPQFVDKKLHETPCRNSLVHKLWIQINNLKKHISSFLKIKMKRSQNVFDVLDKRSQKNNVSNEKKITFSI